LYETLTLYISAAFLKNAKIYNILCGVHSSALYRFYSNIAYRVVYILVLNFMLNLNIAERSVCWPMYVTSTVGTCQQWA